jgi:hypothetical protein
MEASTNERGHVSVRAVEVKPWAHIDLRPLLGARSSAPMSKPSALTLLALALALLGCGGSSSTATETTSETTASPEGTGGGEEHASGEPHVRVFAIAPLGHFHDVFAPIFHADADPARATNACESVSSLHDHATQVQAVSAPEHVDPDHWTHATADLVAQVDALGAACASHGDVDHELDAIHHAFHRVMELSEGHDEAGHH